MLCATFEGPEGPAQSLCATFNGPEGQAQSLCATFNGPEGQAQSLCATFNGPEGQAQDLCATFKGSEGPAQSLCATFEGPEGPAQLPCATFKGSEGNAHLLCATFEGPEGQAQALCATFKGSEGDAHLLCATFKGSEGEAQLLCATFKGPEGPAQLLGATFEGPEGPAQSLGATFDGSEGEAQALGATFDGSEGETQALCATFDDSEAFRAHRGVTRRSTSGVLASQYSGTELTAVRAGSRLAPWKWLRYGSDMIRGACALAGLVVACSSATATPLTGSCADLNFCVGGGGASDPRAIPGNPSAVVDSRNTALCGLALTAVQGSLPDPGGPGCGPSASDDSDGPSTPDAAPTATGVCQELLTCCPSITEPGGAATCNVVALENYGGQVMSVPPDPDACTPAIEYFQREGFCTSIHLEATSAH